MLTVRELVVPALDRLVRDLPLASRARFWSLFELLTRESLTMPVGTAPRFSGICADGTPWQFCVSLGAAPLRGVRYLTEIGAPGAAMSDRVALARRRLDEAISLVGLPQQAAEVIAALFGLLPQASDGLDGLFGAVWIGVGTDAAGELGLRLYANNEWGSELARWQRLSSALRSLRAAGFGRLLRSHVADITQFFSPSGLACSLASQPALKLYLRPRLSPWQACARLTRNPAFRLPGDFLAAVESATGIEFATAPARMLLLSVGAAANGDRPDLKVDLNGQHLFGSETAPQPVVERLAAKLGIDASPYRRLLDVVQATAPPGHAPVHDYIGVGGGAGGLRLNVYLRPPVADAFARTVQTSAVDDNRSIMPRTPHPPSDWPTLHEAS